MEKVGEFAARLFLELKPPRLGCRQLGGHVGRARDADLLGGKTETPQSASTLSEIRFPPAVRQKTLRPRADSLRRFQTVSVDGKLLSVQMVLVTDLAHHHFETRRRAWQVKKP